MARVSAVACVRMYLNTDKCRIPRNDFRDAGTGDFTALKCSNSKVSKMSRVFLLIVKINIPNSIFFLDLSGLSTDKFNNLRYPMTVNS